MNKKNRCLIGMLLLLGFAGAAASDSRPPLLIAYFVPTDRTAIPGYVKRLDRVMTEVQKFYREGMREAGYGPLTFDLPRDINRELVVHVVQGKEPMRSYGRNDSDKVRAEVSAALMAQGIDMNHRTTVIFQLLLEWRGKSAVEVGPYVGGGDYLGGTAWVYDDALLDPRQLGSKEPGGFYGRPCSIGEFNSHYIGGVAHELGHALGLPHVAGPRTNPEHSLMGDGNHTYGQELRGEGARTYLHPASAMLLARCRPFVGDLANARQSSDCDFSDFKALFEAGRLLLAGRLESSPAAFGVIAYNDFAAIPADYDATGWVSGVDPSGNFRLSVGDLQPGNYELRLQVCHTNGTSTVLPFRYDVNAGGVPGLEPFSASSLLLQSAVKAYTRRNMRQLTALIAQIEKRPDAASVLPQVRHLQYLSRPTKPKTLDGIPATEREVPVSDLEFVQASVGWGTPVRDQVLVEAGATCFLQVNNQFYPRGLFAHAPSRYVLALNAGWTSFHTSFGLQDGHAGSVVFVIRADGRDLFRSPKIDDHQLRSIEVQVAGVKRLELVVDDAGDGPSNDWGVWISPALSR